MVGEETDTKDPEEIAGFQVGPGRRRTRCQEQRKREREAQAKKRRADPAASAKAQRERRHRREERGRAGPAVGAAVEQGQADEAVAVQRAAGKKRSKASSTERPPGAGKAGTGGSEGTVCTKNIERRLPRCASGRGGGKRRQAVSSEDKLADEEDALSAI